MNTLLPRSLVLALPILSSMLAACGGGSDAGTSTPPPQAITPPPAAVVPAAPPSATTPPLTATVSSLFPLNAVLDRPTVFEATGTGLDETIRIEIEGCANLTTAAGASPTQRKFTCTPSGQAGSRTVRLSSTVNTSTSVLSQPITYLTPVAKVGLANDGLAVLKEDGSLWLWTNVRSEGRPSHMGNTSTLVGVNFADLEAQSLFSLAIKKDGTLWAWGANTDGVYGNGAVAASATPVQVGSGFKRVAAKGSNTTGGARVVGLKQDGSLWAWGARSTPVPNSPDIAYVPHQFGTGFSELASGSAGESMALRPDGGLWAWNDNLSATPFAVTKFGDDYQSVATAHEASFGIRKNGELWAWRRMAPLRDRAGGNDVPVMLGQHFISLAAGSNYAVALKSDGTLWAYGSGATEQFGNNPGGAGQVPVASEVRQVWAKDDCTVVEKRDGTIWGTDYCALGRMWEPSASGLRPLPQF